ncbi:MAG: GNAT family N-acetyltransferase [Myxococcaceae bacterium]
MSTVIIEKTDPTSAEQICRSITATLPEWFGIPEANERYAQGCLERDSFVARLDGKDVGLIVLEFPFPNNANIYWMGVNRGSHGKNIGTKLFQRSEKYCRSRGCESMTVETLSQKESDANYLKTFKFYEKAGLKPLFELNTYGPEFAMVYMGKFL